MTELDLRTQPNPAQPQDCPNLLKGVRAAPEAAATINLASASHQAGRTGRA
jgi:hypothetical protein